MLVWREKFLSFWRDDAGVCAFLKVVGVLALNPEEFWLGLCGFGVSPLSLVVAIFLVEGE